MADTIYLYSDDWMSAVSAPRTPAVLAELRGTNGWRFSWGNEPGFKRQQAEYGTALIATFNEAEALVMLTSRIFPQAERVAA